MKASKKFNCNLISFSSILVDVLELPCNKDIIKM